jgi:hypothetical protein
VSEQLYGKPPVGFNASMTFNRKLAIEIGLTLQEITVLRKLKSPEAIQNFLTAMPSNPEPDGDTCFSVRAVLKHNCCHCIEAAFLAAAAMMLHGQPVFLMHMRASGDDAHVLALFKRDGHWGAISKSNHIWLRWRDAIYKTPRELVMSYFHEYVTSHRKTLRGYTRPINIVAYDEAHWITPEGSCWDMARELYDTPHIPILTQKQIRTLRKREAFEVKTGKMLEFE